MRTLLLLLSLALPGPASADHASLPSMVCGRYLRGAHQFAIAYDAAAPRDILLNNLDARIRHAPAAGRCVCAHGKLKGEAFATLTKMEEIPESFCAAKGL